MDLRKNLSRLVFQTRELRNSQQIMRLTSPLLEGIVHQNRVSLVPATPPGGIRMGGDDGRPLVDLHAGVVVLRGQSKVLPRPDDDAAGHVLGGEELLDHLVDVLRAGGRPDGQLEVVEAVLHEFPRMGASHEVEGAALRGAVEERAVEVQDDEDATGLSEGGRWSCRLC
ncbi:unnamed protein product [Clonostachys rhizophaga]|uniref:Uncharacterized protein n=1 Tax=Clonostachys rhizophaga TaxID=160324 RepID=A0A9N9VIH1_9HYPO|nr:unnamed protein product [Clonostachys rhizophaga]